MNEDQLNENQSNEAPEANVVEIRFRGTLEQLWIELTQLRADTTAQLSALDTGRQMLQGQMNQFREECRSLLNEPVQDADLKEDLKRLYRSVKVILAGALPQPIREKIHTLQKTFESQWENCLLCGGMKNIGTGKEPVVCPECNGGGKVRKNQPYSYYGPFDATAWNWRDGFVGNVMKYARVRKN